MIWGTLQPEDLYFKQELPEVIKVSGNVYMDLKCSVIQLGEILFIAPNEPFKIRRNVVWYDTGKWLCLQLRSMLPFTFNKIYRLICKQAKHECNHTRENSNKTYR